MKPTYTLPPPSDNRASRRARRRDLRSRAERVIFVWCDVGCVGISITSDFAGVRRTLEAEIRKARQRGDEVPPALALTSIPLLVARDAPFEQVVALSTLPRNVLLTPDQLERHGIIVRPLTDAEVQRLHPLASIPAATEVRQ